jgi:Tol biopolymer transport system component
MELVDGETIADRVERGALPIDEALAIAKQIAEALEAAHERSIVHRDLKPANIKVRSDGAVKVLDFGLAKLVHRGAGILNPSEDSSSNTSPVETEIGTILGSMAYMPPEQAQGKAVDRRADLWAFGCVLFEMLSGHRAFAGATQSDVLVRIIEYDPKWETLPARTPAPVRKLLRRCLEKDPKRRVDSAAVARLEIEDALTMSRRGESVHAEDDRRSWMRQRLIWFATGMVAVLLTLLGVRAWMSGAASVEAHPIRLAVLPPQGTSFGYAALSPDGRWLAFSGVTGTAVQLWIRTMDGTSTRALPGTEGALLPFWSPDSRAIGYFAGGKLRRIDLSGGVPLALADVSVPTGGTWSVEGHILFGTLGGAGLSQVPASGGSVASVIRPDRGRQETDYLNPFFLPDAKHFLYNVLSGRADGRGVFIGSLDGSSGRRLISENSNAEYAPLPAGGGVLLFAREGALLAQPFDPDRRQFAGEPVLVADHVGTTFDASTAGVTRRHFTASNTGVLVFDPENRRNSRLTWMDRSGQRSELMEFDDVVMTRLSPDGRQFAAARFNPQSSGNSDLWIAEADGTNATRLSFDPANDIFPVWSPDGSRVRWASNRDGVYHLYEKAATGSGQDRLLLQTPLAKFPTDWSRDGRLLYRQIDPKTGYDVWFVPADPLGADVKPTPFLQTTANEAAAVLSPSGNSIAYASDESGRYEVYVQSFPSGGSKRQVSMTGGAAPHWRGDGSELFFHAPDGKLMAVPVKEDPGIRTGAPLALFEFRPAGALSTPYYNVTPDGRRFLLNMIVDDERAAPLSALVNWPAVLRQRSSSK